jgi:hypothetical protein
MKRLVNLNGHPCFEIPPRRDRVKPGEYVIVLDESILDSTYIKQALEKGIIKIEDV